MSVDGVRCPACGFESPAGFKFCGQCGGALAAPPAPEAAERRRITVMFCDMVGSTSLSERLDPEELREVLSRYHGTCRETVERLGGHVAQLLGDGMLVYFGYPRAHGDDARRAVQAGLDILSRLGGIQARIGIHTGLVVVGEEQLALGETPNLAARVQAAARPDTVVMSAETHRLVEAFFRVEDLGEHELKGISRPLRLYRVLEAVDPVEARARQAAPLVGREVELRRLGEHWEAARGGAGSVVAVRGRAGMGKSRLAHELKARVRAEGGQALWVWCSAYHRDTSLFPIVDLLERRLGFLSHDTVEQRLQKLDQAPLPEGARRYLATLLRLAPPPELTPQALKIRIMQNLVASLLLLAEELPLLVAVEELDLADPSTLELLERVAEGARQSPVMLLLLTERLVPAFVTDTLDLKPLPPEEMGRLVLQLAPGLDDAVVRRIVERADGVPVYARELTRAVMERGALEEIPATLYDSLMARLDRHAEAREVVQVGATIGRRFAHELIREVSPEPVDDPLTRLVEEDLLDRQGLPPKAVYAFHSALLQDAAYQSLLKSIRQRYHERIAEVVEEKFPEMAEAQPEFVAHHYAEARRWDLAVEYWRQAGERAMQLSANLEAARSFGRALELLRELPEGRHRQVLELGLCTSLAPALIATKGYAAPEVEECYERARRLAEEIGDPAARFPVLAGLWVFHLVRGRLTRAEKLAGQLLDLAGGDPTRRLLAHAAAGETALWQGRLGAARDHLERGLDHHDPERHASLSQVYFSTDPAVASLAYLSWCLWLTGDPGRALEASERSLELARRIEHPHSLAHVQCFACWLHLNQGNLDRTLRLAEEAVALSEEQAFPLWHGVGRVFRGSAWLAGGRPEGGQEMAEGLQALQSTGTMLGASYFTFLLAQLYAGSGAVDEALGALDGALALEEGWWTPELHRLQGDLLVAAGRPGEACECYRRALEAARECGAVTLELRAEVALATTGRAPAATPAPAPP